MMKQPLTDHAERLFRMRSTSGPRADGHSISAPTRHIPVTTPGLDTQYEANREALLYNLAVDDGHGVLGGRRFHPAIGSRNDPNHPWVTWILFHKR